VAELSSETSILSTRLYGVTPYLLTYLLHGTEPFLKSEPVLSYSRNFPHFMEPEGLLLHSQVPAPVPILSQLNPGHNPITHCLKIHLYIILPSTPGYPKWSSFLRFPHQNPVYVSCLPICATCPAHLILLEFITRTILGEQYRSLSSPLCSFYLSPLNLSLLGPNIFSDLKFGTAIFCNNY
jgi:hypothetical protein